MSNPISIALRNRYGSTAKGTVKMILFILAFPFLLLLGVIAFIVIVAFFTLLSCIDNDTFPHRL